MVVALASELSCDERREAVAYDGVDVDVDTYFISRRWLGSCAPLTISNLSLKGQTIYMYESYSYS